MRVQVVMPQLGESIVEGTIVEWHKKIGERVAKGDELFTITTDKVDTGVPAPEAGLLVEVFVDVDSVVSVGQIVATIDTAADASAPSANAASAAPSAPAEATPAPVAAAPVAAAPASSPAAAEAPAASTEDDGASLISPVARQMLKEAGVDPSRVQGTGAQGRILKQDVVNYLAEERSDTPAIADVSGNAEVVSDAAIAAVSSRVTTTQVPTLAPPPILQSNDPIASLPFGRGEEPSRSSFIDERPPRPEFSLPLIPPSVSAATLEAKPEDRVEPMTPARVAISENLTYARRTAAHCATVWDVDMTAVRSARQRLHGDFAKLDVNLTYTPFFLAALASGLQKYPMLNASTDGETIVFRGSITLGIASVWKDGMIVPSIRHVNTLSLLGLSRAVNDLQRRVETGELRPADLDHATFSVSNTGVLGAKFGVPTIFPGQVAVLGIGTIEKRVVVGEDDSLRVRSMATLCLSFDSRVVDFDDADGFMKHVVTYLETTEW